MIPQFSPGELAANGRDPYENTGRFTRVTITVVILHVAVFVIPWLWFNFLKPQEKQMFVMRVSLAEMPKGNSLDVPPAPQPKTLPDKPILPDIPDIPDIPDQKIPDLPSKPEPPPPKPLPPSPPVKPIVSPPKPVAVPKVKTQAKPKTQQKKYLSAEDIRKQIKQQRNDPKNKQRRQAEAAARRRAAQAAARVASERKRILDETARNLEKQYGIPSGGQKGVPATKEFYNYIDRLTGMLYQQWDQPTSTELKKRGIFVLVTLQIAADGTVEAKNFKPSGNAVMDQSVRQLLQKLRVVPAPPGGAMTIPVKLIVSE